VDRGRRCEMFSASALDEAQKFQSVGVNWIRSINDLNVGLK